MSSAIERLRTAPAPAFGERDDRAGELLGAGGALRPVAADDRLDAESSRHRLLRPPRSRPSVSEVKWLIATTTGTPKLRTFCDMAVEVGAARLRAPRDSPCRGRPSPRRHASSARARSRRRPRRRAEPGLAALDVEEFLGAEIGAEAGFGDDDSRPSLQRRLASRSPSCSHGRCWRTGRHGRGPACLRASAPGSAAARP